MSEKKLFLLDAFALIYRAHFAMSQNPRLATNGINTGAIMGFTNSLLEIITKQKPTHIGVAFDTHAPTFRHEAFKEYKAMRQEQPEEIGIAIPYCKKIVEGFNIPILEKDGYEADDLIGTIAKKASGHDFSVYMVTPDKDFAQLVDENIYLYKPARMGNGVEVMGIPEVLAKFDIDQVDQVRDFLGLKGDAVDNIPGIPGIGDKTASKLLRAFGTVERIIENVDKLKGAQKKQVQEFGQQGIMSKKLATIKIDSPIDFDEEGLSYKSPDAAKLKPIFEELEFRTLAKRVFSEENDVNVEDSNQLGLFSSKSNPDEFIGNSIETTDHSYHLVTDATQTTELIQKLEAASAFCFDTETTSLETRDARLVGIAFSMEKGEAWYVNCLDSPNEVISKFKKVMEDPSIEKISEFGQLVVAVSTHHDRIDIARQYPRGVGPTLTALHLGVLARKHDRMAAKLAHGDLEGHAGAGRRLLEEHGECLAFKRPVRVPRLEGKGPVQDAAKRDPVMVLEVEEMTRRAHDPHAAAAANSRQTPSIMPTASRICGSSMTSGGSSLTTLSPAGTASSPWRRRAPTKSPLAGPVRRPIIIPMPRTSRSVSG